MKTTFTKQVICLFLGIITTLSALAQKHKKGTTHKSLNADTITMDLASPQTSTTYQFANKKSIVVIVKNMLPSGHYTVNQTRTLKLLGPIAIPEEKAKAIETHPACPGIEKNLHDAKTESEFAGYLEKAKAANCDAYALYLAHSTSGPINIVNLNNETMVVTVTNTDSKAVWTLTLNTEDRGQFVTLYGFSYIPFLFSKPHTYYANQVLDKNGAPTGSYTVGRGSSEATSDYAPTVSFHFITRQSGVISHSFTAGLGIGLNNTGSSGVNPVVIAGYSVLYNQTIGLNIGLAGHQLNNLKGKYTAGQTISTNLESSDLTEKVIRFNPVISVTFRFNSSPFTSKKLTGTGGDVSTTDPVDKPAGSDTTSHPSQDQGKNPPTGQGTNPDTTTTSTPPTSPYPPANQSTPSSNQTTNTTSPASTTPPANPSPSPQKKQNTQAPK